MKNSYPRKDVYHKNLHAKNNAIGLDPDEQAMNGLYGMPETELEDREHREEGNSRQ